SFQAERSPLISRHPPDFQLHPVEAAPAARSLFKRSDLRAPATVRATQQRRVQRLLHHSHRRQGRIGQQRIHLGAAQQDGAIIIGEARRVPHGGGQRREHRNHRDSHDGGGYQHFQQRESAAGLHGFSTRSILGTPVIGL